MVLAPCPLTLGPWFPRPLVPSALVGSEDSLARHYAQTQARGRRHRLSRAHRCKERLTVGLGCSYTTNDPITANQASSHTSTSQPIVDPQPCIGVVADSAEQHCHTESWHRLLHCLWYRLLAPTVALSVALKHWEVWAGAVKVRLRLRGEPISEVCVMTTHLVSGEGQDREDARLTQFTQGLNTH